MLTLDLKARFKNKTFILSFVGAIVILLQQLGLKQYIPQNWSDILNSTLIILAMLGIVVDTSTPGISDKLILPNEQGTNNNVTFTVGGANIPNGDIKIKNEDSTSQVEIKEDSINAGVQANTASSKIVVDVPQE